MTPLIVVVVASLLIPGVSTVAAYYSFGVLIICAVGGGWIVSKTSARFWLKIFVSSVLLPIILFPTVAFLFKSAILSLPFADDWPVFSYWAFTFLPLVVYGVPFLFLVYSWYVKADQS